jgi:polyisoprenyl-teichoic acid--peptidoglycan teichoic acid transferase
MIWGNSLGEQLKVGVPNLDRSLTVLVLGTKVLSSDLDRPSQRELGYQRLVNSLDGLSDTMLLLRLDPETQRVTVLSIPRDTRTWIEGRGYAKVNEANALGGAALSTETVSEMLGGIAIDRYVRVNVQGIEKLVDAVGGLDLHVPKDMKYQDHSQHLYINLKEGRQHLNGNQVLQFLRFRYDEWGDIGRIQRQQSLIRAFREQALNPLNLVRLPQVFSIVHSHLDTNLALDEWMAIAGFLANRQQSNLEMLMLPGSFSNTEEDPISYWLPDSSRISDMMAQHFDPAGASYTSLIPPDPANLWIAIQDSTGQPGAVSDLVDRLLDSGYQRIDQGSPWSEPLRVTRIIAQQGDQASAEALQQALGFGDVRIESTGELRSDITIQLGQDWLHHARAGAFSNSSASPGKGQTWYPHDL